MQVVESRAPGCDVVISGWAHGTQCAAPQYGWYVPSEHNVHMEAGPRRALNLPGGQWLQPWPGVTYCPAGHVGDGVGLGAGVSTVERAVPELPTAGGVHVTSGADP